MMPKDATKKVACIACGADVRSEALFCYNCGGAVAAQPHSDRVVEQVETKQQETLAAPQADESIPESKADVPVVTGTGADTRRKPLTSAMLRRKRASNRQPVEVIWEEPARPSMMFVVASVILTILTVLILAAALYLK
jgi:hypothetical protein